MEWQHEVHSWRKWLAPLFANVPTYHERARGPFVRPSLRIEDTAPQMLPTGGKEGAWIDNRTVTISYFASGYDNMLDKEQLIINKLWTAKYITGYLKDFKYPSPFVKAVSFPGSTIGGVTVYVYVTGVDKNNIETLADFVQFAVPSGDNGVQVRPDRYPMSTPWFEKYNVYITNNQSSIKLNAGQLTQPIAGGWITGNFGALGSGANLPTTSEIPFRSIKVLDIESRKQEDPIDDGVWDLHIMVKTQSIGIPLRRQDKDQLKTINRRVYYT